MKVERDVSDVEHTVALSVRRTRKRGKGFGHGGPRQGLAYEAARVRAVTPEVEEAKQAYPLTMVARRLGYKRASLKVILCKSGLPYLVVKGGPGPGSTYLPRSTVDALVARKIMRVGRWATPRGAMRGAPKRPSWGPRESEEGSASGEDER